MHIRVTALAAAVLAVSCGTPDRLPTAAVPNGGEVGQLNSVLASPMKRTTPLAAPVTWSFVVGTEGTVSSNSGVGLMISVPAGAVAGPTTITVTALAGSDLAYAFEPHGLRFARPVTLTQSLNGVETGLLSQLIASGAHFAGATPQYVDGLAIVNETVAASVDLLSASVAFPIGHFSGWIVASGRSEGDSSGTSEAQ